MQAISQSVEKLCSQNLPDETLLELCQKYGFQARIWKQKFLGLLPEVNRRKLYEKKGFGSIVEFAAKIRVVSKEQVKRVLSLAEYFEDKPVLKSLLENGKVSVNKLARVASIATVENQEVLADQVRLLPQKALETLVRDEKNAVMADLKNQNGLDEPNSNHEFVRTHNTHEQSECALQNKFEENKLHLSTKVQQKLLELQNKSIDINEMILEFLEKRDLEIAQEKQEIVRQEQEKYEHESEIWREERHPSRYIPARIKRIIEKEYGTKCSIQNCEKSAENVHHTQTFSMGQNHDPRFLAPLCKEHHVIAHSVNVKFQEKRRVEKFT